MIYLPFKNNCLSRKTSKKRVWFWNAIYSMLLKVHCSSFSAVAACTFNWPIIDIFRNKDELREWTAPTFKCDLWKRKRNMESTVWKFTMESIVHRIWKVYGNYSMSLLMPEYTVLRDNSTRRNFYIFALLRFDVVRNSICIVSFLLVLKTLLFLSIIHLALIWHSLKHIWSTPFR